MSKYADKYKRHQEITEELHQTYQMKNDDYDDSFGRMFQSTGLSSAAFRIGDKYNRLQSFANGGNLKVGDESIQDTLMDMANYCIMSLIELELMDEDKVVDSVSTVDCNVCRHYPEDIPIYMAECVNCSDGNKFQLKF